MITLMFSNQFLSDFGARETLREFNFPAEAEIVEYPEHGLLRGKMMEWCVDQLIEDVIILTDSDFILDCFRIQVKRGWLAPSDLRVYVVTQYDSPSGYPTLEAMVIDQDGRFSVWPKLFDFMGDLLVKLL